VVPANVENPAAVLVPIVGRGEAGVLLTLRTEEMSHHAGQICFPGGRYHEEDDDFTTTALRETEEELGIGRDLISVLGFLDPYQTSTGYTVMPVVGWLPVEIAMAPDRQEVADIFEVPLRHLLDPGNQDVFEAVRGGEKRQFRAIRYGERIIWGATAGMIFDLSRKLAAP
jgi:8-oxo-dGTP pyrophosphatase MutT (NUDIX family)